MGAFELKFGSADGVRVAPNVLSYYAHGAMMRRALPTESGTLAWRIGFAGPMFRTYSERPNYDFDSFTLSPRNKLSDFEGDWANAAGAPDDGTRELSGYEMRDVTWTVAEDVSGAIIDSGWHAWQHRVTWAAHGDWEPTDWDEATDGPFHAPYKWADCARYLGDRNFPYCTPSIFPGWWAEYSNPDPVGPQNPWSVDCVVCQQLGIWGISGFPVGAVFVALQQGSEDPVLFAAAKFNAPTWWRPGAYIACRYRGRFGR